MNLLNREPVVIVTFVEAVLALAIGFGVPLDPAQIGLIVAAGLAPVVRSKVSPVNADTSDTPEVGDEV